MQLLGEAPEIPAGSPCLAPASRVLALCSRLELVHGTAWEWTPGMRVDPHSSLLRWVAVGKVQPFLIGLNVSDQAEPSWATPRLCLLLKGRCTRSVGITPVLIGCSAP